MLLHVTNHYHGLLAQPWSDLQGNAYMPLVGSTDENQRKSMGLICLGYMLKGFFFTPSLSQGRFQLEDLPYDPERAPRYYRNAYLHLQPFYNTTHSFLDIHRLRGILECGRTQEVLVDYYIDPADVNPDQEVVFSYYVRLGNEDW